MGIERIWSKNLSRKIVSEITKQKYQFLVSKALICETIYEIIGGYDNEKH